MSGCPGKSFREGMSLLQIADMFSTGEKARAWVERIRWPNGPRCPHCGSHNVQCGIKHKTMTHRCRDCAKKPMFTARKGTVMEGTKMPYRTWAIGLYLYSTNIKGVSSMRLHRELGITQKSAWFMLQRLREASKLTMHAFSGPGKAKIPPARKITVKPRSYQPSKKEFEEETDMPGMSEKELRETFMRPFEFVEKS